jgi:rfaE bifunctional protein nucleotidyltransferase chain/domain
MLDIDSIESFTSNKILSFSKAKNQISNFKKNGKKVGLCHGGFDLLHPGHMKHFEAAKKICDILFVSITSDKYVSKRKDTGRPIFTDKLRAYSIASVEFVDYVIISDYKLATDVIHHLKPSFYIKGPDFIHKTTPGITAERKAIKDVGGEIKYTRDPVLSTTKIVDYIKNNINRDKVLLIIDRDGTLIHENDFIGKDKNWRENISLNKDVVDSISNIQTKYNTVALVISNQAGVARGYFNCKRVEEINNYINSLLKKNHITIHNWQYCPDVDKDYADKTPIDFKKEFIKKKTKRKPSTDMVFDGLKSLKMELKEFSKIIIFGDRHEDEGIAEKLNAHYIDVKNKDYNDLILEYKKIMN